MSISVMTMVWARLAVSGGELHTALALADCADDDGTSIFPSVELLCFKTRQSRRSVQRQLRRLQRIGWLLLVKPSKGGRYRSAEYRIDEAWIYGAKLTQLPDLPPRARKSRTNGVGDGAKPRHSRHETASPMTPNPSRPISTHQTSSSVTASARARAIPSGSRGAFRSKKAQATPLEPLAERIRKARALLDAQPDHSPKALKRMFRLSDDQLAEVRSP
jgi:hypothetical protein